MKSHMYFEDFGPLAGAESSIFMDGSVGSHFVTYDFSRDHVTPFFGDSSCTVIWWARSVVAHFGGGGLVGEIFDDAKMFTIGSNWGGDVGTRGTWAFDVNPGSTPEVKVWSTSPDGSGFDESVFDMLTPDNITSLSHTYGSTSSQATFGSDDWHMYAISMKVRESQSGHPFRYLAQVDFTIDGEEQFHDNPASPIIGGDTLFARDGVDHNIFSFGSPFGYSSWILSMQLHSIIVCTGYVSPDALIHSDVYNDGDAPGAEFPNNTVELPSINNTFEDHEAYAIHWWRPGFDPDNIGKDYIRSADFWYDPNALNASHISHDAPGHVHEDEATEIPQ